MSEHDRWPSDPSPAEDGSCARDPVSDGQHLTRELAKSVHHHVRTPLTGVVGHAELLLDREDELPADVRRSLAALLQAARRLNDVALGVCDLIDMTCADPNGVEPVDITALVAAEVAACRERAEPRGVRFLICSEPGGRCVTDARRLRRALRELLDNAVTHAPERSTIRVTCAITISGLRIEVTDDGAGIGAADRARLAKPFERGTHPHRPDAGRGMGLAVASTAAAALGGRLILSEGSRGGLRASLELPLDTAPAIRAGGPLWT